MDPELNEIKPLRRRLGLTQAQLAQAAHVSQSLVAKVEAGSAEPGFSAGKRLLAALRNQSRRREPTAGALMQRHVIACAPDDRLAAAIATMRRRAISQLPVTEHDNVVGLLTESGVIRDLAKLNEKTRVRDVMEDAPPILPAEAPRAAVAELLNHYPLVLVKGKGKLLGIVTKSDLLRTL